MILKQKQAHSFSFSLELSGEFSDNNLLDKASLSILYGYKKLISDKNNISLLDICNDDLEFKISKDIAIEISNKYKKLIIFGIGGSSLGGQALCGSRFYQYLSSQTIEIIFIDNLHYHNFNIFLENLDFTSTAFLTISKSGKTLETLSQILVTQDFFKKDIEKLGAENFYFITEDSKSPLKDIADNLKRPIIPHSNQIGGRYSCFTSVAMIPAILTGINISEYIKGGKNIIDNFLNEAEDSMVFKGASIIKAAMDSGYSNHVFIPYLQRLYQTTYWYAQLFAESLGKNGMAMTPIKALGSVDQHSQLQLYLDGPKDKFFTFITQSTEDLGNEIIIPHNVQDIDYFNNNKLGDVIFANQESTIETLIEQKCPVRRIHFENFSDKALGEILMFFMLETILLGYAMNINPFDQPAVETGKIKARNILLKNNK